MVAASRPPNHYQTHGAAGAVNAMRAAAWEAIKADRDRRASMGVKVGSHWFHSDQKSRTQQLGLVLLGQNIPAGLQWKTLTYSPQPVFVTMTPALAQAIVQATAGRHLLRTKQMQQALQLMRAYFEQVFIAADQLVNALIPPLDGTVSYADETLSARAYRAHRDGKVLGKLFMPIINLLFFWQGPDHCKNAYTKEFDRKNYPSEYQPPNQPRYTSRNVVPPPSRVRPPGAGPEHSGLMKTAFVAASFTAAQHRVGGSGHAPE